MLNTRLARAGVARQKWPLARCAPPRRKTAGARVLAFMHRDVHRAETIESLARGFSSAWLGVLQSGGQDEMSLQTLRGLADDSITVETAHPFGCSKSKVGLLGGVGVIMQAAGVNDVTKRAQPTQP